MLSDAIWISRVESEQPAVPGPLAGLRFAVKDNIDVAGMPTTAACPAYAYTPTTTATVVDRLVAAGAVLAGKTNMDQFATGLVGTRTPYGACSSVFDERFISGGSSSGSAVAVAKRLVDFALGTDTAGSGRVPAAFNNLIGLKPTRGLISTAGVVPACRTLDCVSVFARDCATAFSVLQQARGADPEDPFSRVPEAGQGAAPWLGGAFRFGVPSDTDLQFFGDQEAGALYRDAVRRLENLGHEKVEIDFRIFREAAQLLYAGPWVAERLAAIQSFIAEHGADMNPAVRSIICGGSKYTAVDAFRGAYRLQQLLKEQEKQWAIMDVMFLPTTGTIYTHEQIASDPVGLNTNLGYYTNFVNLMDLAAVAAPAGFRSNGLPFGVSFIGRAFTDEPLLRVADVFTGQNAIGVSGRPGCIDVAVLGAHLEGMPLNWQLTERGARIVRRCRTAPGYRLYALSGTKPLKPGLIRDDTFTGPGIEAEVWSVPEDQFGSFVAAVPPPLGIGSALLNSGETVKSFICEPWAVAGATEITSFGGWRAYMASLK